MKIKKICPKCGNELIKETNKEIDYPYLCEECDENFYNFEVIEKKYDYTDEDIQAIYDANIKITPFSTVLSEEDYYKYIQGGEAEIFKNPLANELSNDYILVLHEGEFDFVRYDISGLTEVKRNDKTQDEYYSFGGGIYCYDAKTHIPLQVKEGISIYKGHYNGKYLECIYDCNPSDECDKGYGNEKEYLLLTDGEISVKAI